MAFMFSRILDARQHENHAARIFYFLHIREICRPGSRVGQHIHSHFVTIQSLRNN